MASAVYDELLKKSQSRLELLQKLKQRELWSLVDVTAKESVFDYVAFQEWWVNTVLPNFATKEDKELYALEADIVFYMNRSICFVSSGKPCYYVLKEHTIFKQNYWCPMTEDDFKKAFRAYKVPFPVPSHGEGEKSKGNKEKTRDRSLYDIYSKSDLRRVHDDVVFCPRESGETTDPRYLNLWMGYKYPVTGLLSMEEAAKDPRARGTCMMFLEHLYRVHCGSSKTLFNFVMDWFSVKMRDPGRKMSTTICLYSKKQRVGKGFTIGIFGDLFGQHYAQTTDSHDITGRFTTVTDNLVLLFLDEAFFSGDKGQGQKLKGKVTEKMQRQERKYGDARVTLSATSYVFATNDTAVIPGDATDKRHFILESREDHASDDKYYHQFVTRMNENDNAAIRCLGWILLRGWRVDPDFGFSGQNAPVTRMMLLMKQNNYKPEEGFIAEVLSRGYFCEPDGLSDNVPLTGNWEEDQYHIWNFHPWPGAVLKQLVHERFEKSFQRHKFIRNTLMRTDEKGEVVKNLIHDGRVDPRQPGAFPKRTWQRFISAADIKRSWERYLRRAGLNNRYGKVPNFEMLLAQLAHYMVFPTNQALTTDNRLPAIGSQSRIIRCFADDDTGRVVRKEMEYYYFPPLGACRARFMNMVGAVFTNAVMEGGDPDTSIPEEREDIRHHYSLVSGVFDYDKPWEDTFSVYDFARTNPWPEAERRINPDTGMRLPLRKRVREEDAVAIVYRPQGKSLGSLDDELQIIQVTKKRKLDRENNNNNNAVPTQVVAVVEEPAPIPAELPQEGDLAFLHGSLDDNIDQFLAEIPNPTAVQENNTNVMPEITLPDDWPVDNPFGDEMYYNVSDLFND